MEYAENIVTQNIEVINSDVVATLMVAFMENRPSWGGACIRFVVIFV